MIMLSLLLELFIFVVGVKVANILLKELSYALRKWDRRVERKLIGRRYERQKRRDPDLD